MKIDVTVKPRSRRVKVEKTDQGYVVCVNEPPVDGKANEALVEALADYLGIRRSRITILAGLKSRKKTVLISK
ncbi:MAG: DUF167 domain-containing protein [Planctomycetota bacterium]|nr:DUF167 domain-containing protein [Planctomycetota bacterium]